jgi:hypothetical protein
MQVCARPIDHAVGIGPVTGQIAAADDPVIAAAGVIENSFESLPITVQIAYDEVAHWVLRMPQALVRRTTVISGGAPILIGRAMVPMPAVT